jgi:hypothetical protein
MEFDIQNKKKASQLSPMYFTMLDLPDGVVIQVPSAIHQTPSYNARHFYKPISTCIIFPNRESLEQT